MMSVSSTENGARRRKKRYRDQRRSRHSIENETLLLHDMPHDVSKGARPKVYYSRKHYHPDDIGENVRLKLSMNTLYLSLEDVEDDVAVGGAVKKVNSQVDIDEKTGKVVSSSTSTECDLAKNIDDNDKLLTQKIIKLQQSSSLPDLQAGNSSSSPSSSATISSNSNNQIQGHGKHVILAVEEAQDDDMNRINDATGGDADQQLLKQKIKLNIDPSSNGSSSSASSNNLEYGNSIVSNTSTLWSSCNTILSSTEWMRWL